MNAIVRQFQNRSFLGQVILSLSIGIALVASAQPSLAQNNQTVFENEGTIEKTPAIGTKWTYQHIGMRSSGNIGLPSDGDRTREIVASRTIDGNKLWESRETWGNNDADPVRYLYDEKGFVHQVEQGAEVETISPPMAFDFIDLKPGEIRETEGVGKMSEGDIRFQVKATRLMDETIDTSAGVFKNCLKIQTILTVYHPRFNNVPIQLIYMNWYHPKANGLVKESFKGNPPANGGDWKEPVTGVSLLKSYTPGTNKDDGNVKF